MQRKYQSLELESIRLGKQICSKVCMSFNVPRCSTRPQMAGLLLFIHMAKLQRRKRRQRGCSS